MLEELVRRLGSRGTVCVSVRVLQRNRPMRERGGERETEVYFKKLARMIVGAGEPRI